MYLVGVGGMSARLGCVGGCKLSQWCCTTNASHLCSYYCLSMLFDNAGSWPDGLGCQSGIGALFIFSLLPQAPCHMCVFVSTLCACVNVALPLSQAHPGNNQVLAQFPKQPLSYVA